MAVVEIDLPSGFEADLEGRFTEVTLSKKSEIRNQKTVVLYYDEVSLMVLFCFLVFNFIHVLPRW